METPADLGRGPVHANVSCSRAQADPLSVAANTCGEPILRKARCCCRPGGGPAGGLRVCIPGPRFAGQKAEAGRAPRPGGEQPERGVRTGWPPQGEGAGRPITTQGDCPSAVGAPLGTAVSGQERCRPPEAEFPGKTQKPVPDARHLFNGLRGGCRTETLRNPPQGR